MNEPILEVVISTLAGDGTPHVAPMGVRQVGAKVVLMPFKPSTTLANIVETRVAVLNRITDARVFAGCVSGRRTWPLLPAERIRGVRLACALSHLELELASHADDPLRPVLQMQPVHEVAHANFAGLNRAQAAVVEAAVLVSRLSMLPAAKVDAEMAYLQIAIDKTAGPAELEAWSWLQTAVEQFRERAASGIER